MHSSPPSSPDTVNVLKSLRDAAETAVTPIVIAVMGATGTGKSTFINLISGSKLGVSTGLKSCTSSVDATEPFVFKNRKVVLFDTPGFDDTNTSDADILNLIANFLAITYEEGAVLSGVIYMHRISDVRMGGTAMRNFSMFRKLCGEKSLKNVAIVTNFWSKVEPDEGAAREAELRDEFFKPALDQKAKFLQHDGTHSGACKVLEAIMANHPMALDIQVEMSVGKSLLETAAGVEMNGQLAEQARKHEVELKKLADEMMQAIKERDEQSRNELQEAVKELEEKTQRVQMERQKLAANHEEERANMEREYKQKLADMRAC